MAKKNSAIFVIKETSQQMVSNVHVVSLVMLLYEESISMFGETIFYHKDFLPSVMVTAV